MNYKKPALTLACVASLHEQFGKEFEKNEMELIIVDNDSRDSSVEKLRESVRKNLYKSTHIIANKENGGFGKGNNVGVETAKGKYLLFLNNDTVVKDKGILDMASYLEDHEHVAILGGQLRNVDNTPQPSIGKFYTLYNAFLLLLGMQKFGLLDKSPVEIAEVDWVKGGLLMIRAEIFRKLSGFDENIFMYTEDMELCYRATKAGYKVMFYPKVTVVHEEHGSGNRSFAIINIYKGLRYFYKKHKSLAEFQLLSIMLYMKAWIAIGIGTLTGNSNLVKTYREAIKL